MLVNLKEILAIAEERKCAVGAFNTPNLECLLAVLDAAQKLGTPVIISHAELHESISPLSVQGRFPDSGYTECVVFDTDFRSAFFAKNAAPLAPRDVYTDYLWVLARTDGGSWEVVTSGYA